jgi:hypothetical protein
LWYLLLGSACLFIVTVYTGINMFANKYLLLLFVVSSKRALTLRIFVTLQFQSSCGTDNSRCTTSTKKSRSTTQSKLESSRSPTLETPTVMSTLCCHLKDLLTTLPSRSVDNNQCQCIFMKLLFMFFDNKLFVNLFWPPNHITVSVASRNKMYYKHLSNSGVDLQQFKIQIRQNNIERDPCPLVNFCTYHCDLHAA